MTRGKLLAIAAFGCLIAAGLALPTAAKGPSGSAKVLSAQALAGPAVGTDLQLTKTVIGSGAALTYIIGVLNDGPTPATQTIALTDTAELGAGGTLTYGAVAVEGLLGGVCDSGQPSQKPITCSGFLSPGGRLTLTVPASCDATEPGFRVTNTATVTGNLGDLTPTNNTASALLVDCAPQPTAVTMVSFRGESGKRKIVLRWRTGTELDVIGFQLRRSRNGAAARNVTPRLIRAKGPNGVGGASYRFVDRNVRPGVRYRYSLQAVELDGTRKSFPPVSASAHR